jgi:hypothetical protein
MISSPPVPVVGASALVRAKHRGLVAYIGIEVSLELSSMWIGEAAFGVA